jgi:hypothetical protein
MHKSASLTFEVEILLRDGIYSATCAQLPGFFLCSGDLNKLHADISPALGKLLAVQNKLRGIHKSPAVMRNPAAERLIAYRELAAA